jgi:two-component system chemotaxis response regulator CheB
MAARVEAIAIGASAGAVQALSRVLPVLPADYPIPLLVVVHVPPDRDNALVALLQSKSAITMKEAEDKEPIQPGVAYFAPSDYHLLVEGDRTLSLSRDDLVLHSRPSIDVMFESAAEAYGPSLLGVVLSGANEDGARGARAILSAGGTVWAEDPAEAYAAAMPGAALAVDPRVAAFPLDAIATNLRELAAP